MKDPNSKLTPSLLESESRGGDNAESGFSFQENVVLSRVPMWLAQDGFTAMIREATGDTEAKFFIPGHGFAIELLEIKNHDFSTSEFWNEVERFQRVDAGSPNTYRWFTLASTGVSQELKPLVNGLRRIRDPYSFYEDDSAIKDNSFKDYAQIVKKLGHTDQEARFLFKKVLIDTDLNTAQSYGEALFIQSLAEHLQEYQNLSYKTLKDIYTTIGQLIRKHKNKPISRLKLETKIREKIQLEQLPPLRPVQIHTSIQNENDCNVSGLRFDWVPFFGGKTRSFPSPEKWDQQLVGELRETRDWIVKNRCIRRIKLTGDRRLSASLAIGSIFSAVAGFAIEMDYRGQIWATDAHPTSDTPEYPLLYKTKRKVGEQLIVSVGILRDIASEVEGDLERHGLAGMPILHVKGKGPIVSPQHANIAVEAVKHAISQALSRTRSKEVHLFFAGPSHLALFLGHRLNATAPIQCYERTLTGRYVPTCRLFSAHIG